MMYTTEFIQGKWTALSMQTYYRGKLDPHWTGPWGVVSIKGPLTLELQMGSTKQIVHVNLVRPLLVGDADRSSPLGRWSPLCSLTTKVQCLPMTVRQLKILRPVKTQLDTTTQ